jgi:SagB-type dehydrogenase family enzyme
MPDQPDYRVLKADGWVLLRQTKSDKQLRVAYPALEEPYPPEAQLLELPPPESFRVGGMSVREAIRARQSRRQFTDAPLSREELAFLCWATQGVRSVAPSGVATLRTVPSGGARHPFETYLVVRNVVDLTPGLYRYLALAHQLCLLRAGDFTPEAVAACAGQRMVAGCAVLFCWAAVPYRAEWRYPIVATKLIAQDSGHVCGQLYLACESIGCGTCAVGAYDQQAMDALLGVDGERQFAIYAAPVGKV